MLSEDKSGRMYEYGCLMVYLDLTNWSDYGNFIEKNDLYKDSDGRFGVETQPHITILYGIHSEVPDELVIEKFSKIEKTDFSINCEGIDCFNNQYYDVLKINIVSEKLNELNTIARKLPHTLEYKDYKPHITIAYLNCGCGFKYSDSDTKISINEIKNIVYSKTNGEKIIIPFI